MVGVKEFSEASASALNEVADVRLLIWTPLCWLCLWLAIVNIGDTTELVLYGLAALYFGGIAVIG